jgi:GT2 family glycosyltransferase
LFEFDRQASARTGISGLSHDNTHDSPMRLQSVSVIIPTKDRVAELSLTLRTLFQQSSVFQQLIIVDQGTTDESQKATEREWQAAPVPLRDSLRLDYIREPQISGLAVARNRAIELAQAEVWLFLDDDVELAPDFLERLLEVYARDPEVDGVSGIITNYRRPPVPFRAWSLVFERGPFHDERQPVYWNADHLRQCQPVVVRKLGGGLMSFRASSIRDFRFDDSLRGVSLGEDVDFCARLGPRAKLVIEPRARLKHNQSPVGRSRDHWLCQNALSAHYLYHRNWNHGIKNRLCLVWLSVGYALVATVSSMLRCSFDPWRALRTGIRDAHERRRQSRLQGSRI